LDLVGLRFVSFLPSHPSFLHHPSFIHHPSLVRLPFGNSYRPVVVASEVFDIVTLLYDLAVLLTTIHRRLRGVARCRCRFGPPCRTFRFFVLPFFVRRRAVLAVPLFILLDCLGQLPRRAWGCPIVPWRDSSLASPSSPSLQGLWMRKCSPGFFGCILDEGLPRSCGRFAEGLAHRSASREFEAL